jgi:hypothetical protein
MNLADLAHASGEEGVTGAAKTDNGQQDEIFLECHSMRITNEEFRKVSQDAKRQIRALSTRE